MSLRGRFDRLQRLTHGLVRGQGVTCTTCRRSPSTARLVWLIEEPEDELFDCPGCERPVTKAGVPIGYVNAGGEYLGKVVRLISG